MLTRNSRYILLLTVALIASACQAIAATPKVIHEPQPSPVAAEQLSATIEDAQVTALAAVTEDVSITVTETVIEEVTASRAVNAVDEPVAPDLTIGKALPSASALPAPSALEGGVQPCTTEYEVKAGDTLSAIADRFGSDIDSILTRNGKDDRDSIRVGQRLYIPCADEGRATPAPASPSAALTPNWGALHADSAEVTSVGLSTTGEPIEAYRFGEGPNQLVLIGGIHGGYEWNTVLLAYHMLDYFAENPEAVPASISLVIIPVANPDGLKLVTGTTQRFSPADVAENTRPGRFNGNGVDLNRNWECNWLPTALWGQEQISGGDSPFSEVETQRLAEFLNDEATAGVVFWHSANNGVFAGGCTGRHAGSDKLGETYATASGYPFQQAFTSYAVTGDATDWLSFQGIPAITVELNNHTDTDWEQNLRGVLAILDLFR